jgi:membrane protein DedA with SNARE-associated domain
VTLVGYFAGEGYEAAMRVAGRGSAAILVLVMIVIVGLGAKRLILRRLVD